MVEKERILILGIGNVLLGDEGVGVHVIREMEKHELPGHVTLLDGGTGGFHLLSWIQDYKEIILVDAALDGNPPGSINVIYPRYSTDFPRTLSSHDIGLKDLIESAALLGKLPKITLITVSVNPEQSLTMDLSPEIFKSVAEIMDKIKKIISG